MKKKILKLDKLKLSKEAILNLNKDKVSVVGGGTLVGTPTCPTACVIFESQFPCNTINGNTLCCSN
ncbi:class I lanthipeptide [Taibaiella koreensis]|uniref:class I lanthipeptide n=1 Tax=Taibaiella koreensis TaxID=1268548 RepID=UPI0013C32DD8|nr:class I lanthipeptide [Taibaiella koreensis]